MKPHIYFDMDGVLAKYEESAYSGPTPLFSQRGKHYFRHLQADPVAVDAFVKLYTMDEYGPENVTVVSSIIGEGSLFLEHYHDKLAWLDEHVYSNMRSKRAPKNYERLRLLPCLGSKADTVAFRHWNGRSTGLMRSDILIDDYNENLVEWRDRGGLAIKYQNAVNTKNSLDVPVIDMSMSADDIVDFIETIADMQFHE